MIALKVQKGEIDGYGNDEDVAAPDLQQMLGAVHGNQNAMDGFARVNAGVTSPAEFFSEENVGRIFAAAG